MDSLNTNDYAILNSVVDTDRNIGMSKLRGVTVVELSEITGFSTTKIRNSLKKLREHKYVDYGVKRVKQETFHITRLGVEVLTKIGENICGIDEEEEYDDTINEDEVAVDKDKVVEVTEFEEVK